MVSGVNFKLGWRGSMQFSMRRMIIFMGRLVVCNTWVMRYVKGIYLPRYFMFQSMKEIANKKLQKKKKKKNSPNHKSFFPTSQSLSNCIPSRT